MNLPDNLKINKNNHLEIGGCDTVKLAQKYKTPLYVFDEAFIRKVVAEYLDSLKEFYPNSTVCYASKAFCVSGIYKILDRSMGVDVVSGGELYTALGAGVDANRIYFHGNNKTIDEIEYAINSGVHALVLDYDDEIQIVNDIASKYNKVQGVMLRINAGIEAHTHHYLQTAKSDSKFGFAKDDVIEIAKQALKKSNLKFLGIHCHIGSQIFEIAPYQLAVQKMTDIIAQLAKCGMIVEELNLGGGFGVAYTQEDKPLKIADYIKAIAQELKECIKQKNIKPPKLILEPGRSIIANSGITLYTVGAIKELAGIKTYVAIDGGMYESPRYALYQAQYRTVICNRANEKPNKIVTVAGKCCESGDIIVGSTEIVKPRRGDILAVLTTGAYNYSMAGNYNKNTIPAVVLVNGGKSDYLVKRQTYEELNSRDTLPEWLKN